MDRAPLIFISAGEASGDLHASALVEAMKERCPEAEFVGIGGPRMERAGVDLLCSYDELAVVGLLEVLSHAGPIIKALRDAKRFMDHHHPNLVILVDFPDFNFRIGTHASRRNIPVFYYICPQVWAWRQGRARKLARMADSLAVILPFEEEFYRRRGIPAYFVGHPLLDTVRPSVPAHEFRRRLGISKDAPLVALLPGSRRGELRRHVPLMLEAASLIQRDDPATRFVVPLLAPAHQEIFLKMAGERGGPKWRPMVGETWNCLAAADMAVAASGTVTLEAAILETPMVVTYRVSPLTYLLGRWLIKVQYASLVNLIAGREVVPELLQTEAIPEKIAATVGSILSSSERLQRMKEELRRVKKALGGPGACHRAAELALKTAQPIT